MMLGRKALLCSVRSPADAAGAVKADTAATACVNYGAVYIYIMYYGAIHVKHRGVVAERTPAPAAPVKAIAGIAVTIINATVKAYMRAPVTGMITVITIIKSPVTGCPV
jgi:hypothetical protein